MIPNCMGCKDELEIASWEDEWFIATTKDFPESYPVGRHHFNLWMVNKKGEIMISNGWDLIKD